MRHLFHKTLTLKSTGQLVRDLDAATPRGLRRTPPGYTTVIIHQHKGHSIQRVRNDKLQRGTSDTQRAFNRSGLYANA